MPHGVYKMWQLFWNVYHELQLIKRQEKFEMSVKTHTGLHTVFWNPFGWYVSEKFQNVMTAWGLWVS